MTDNWNSHLFSVSKYQRYLFRLQVINRTERGLENKLHSVAITDVFKFS